MSTNLGQAFDKYHSKKDLHHAIEHPQNEQDQNSWLCIVGNLVIFGMNYLYYIILRVALEPGCLIASSVAFVGVVVVVVVLLLFSSVEEFTGKSIVAKNAKTPRAAPSDPTIYTNTQRYK
jgi:heme/copper-type cytochrome/quinol oxidase subunit 3